jgi:hypothetical protein
VTILNSIERHQTQLAGGALAVAVAAGWERGRLQRECRGSADRKRPHVAASRRKRPVNTVGMHSEAPEMQEAPIGGGWMAAFFMGYGPSY